MTVVVVPPDIDAFAGIEWRGELRVVNPDSSLGLSSSLRLGIAAVADTHDLDGAFILLGDQPRTALSTLAALASAARDVVSDEVEAVVPRYADGGGANPVLLLSAGFPLVALAVGDHGLGGLLAARPDRVLTVPLPGSNPDVDTLEDLEALRPTLLGLGRRQGAALGAVETVGLAATLGATVGARLAGSEAGPFSAKVIAALRNEFGGHAVKSEESAQESRQGACQGARLTWLADPRHRRRS